MAGETEEDAVDAVRDLTQGSLLATVGRLGEYTREPRHAEAAVRGYVALLDLLAERGLSKAAEVSVKLTALGLDIDQALALENVLRIADATARAGTTLTVDMEDHSRTHATLATVDQARAHQPDIGVVVQAMLRRTEGDCRDLSRAGARVRLCKGAYAEPPSVAHQAPGDVDEAFARCMRILVDGPGYTMIATHDPAQIHHAIALLEQRARPPETYEFQLLYGVRTEEQLRLRASGHPVRVYVPYGDEWFGYLLRRLAERPANLALLLHALRSNT